MDLDELALGMAVETAQLLFVRKKLSFAHDYDNRPFHTDEEYAKTTPLGKLISPEVMSFMSELAKYLEVDFFGEDMLAENQSKQNCIILFCRRCSDR